MMTANVKPAACELSPGELDGVSGGWGAMVAMGGFGAVLRGVSGGGGGGASGGQNDPAQMFQQILQQLTQG